MSGKDVNIWRRHYRDTIEELICHILLFSSHRYATTNFLQGSPLQDVEHFCAIPVYIHNVTYDNIIKQLIETIEAHLFKNKTT